jgi:hypothetical protein
MKAVRCVETSGINTPAATLHWIYFSSHKAVRFFQSRQKHYKIRIRKNEEFSVSVRMYVSWFNNFSHHGDGRERAEGGLYVCTIHLLTFWLYSTLSSHRHVMILPQLSHNTKDKRSSCACDELSTASRRRKPNGGKNPPILILATTGE